MDNRPALGNFSVQPANGYDAIRYRPPGDQEEARERGRVERQGDGTDIIVENADETPQVRFLLDLFCYLSFLKDNEDHPQDVVLDMTYTTHTQVKRDFVEDHVDILWFSDNRAMDGVLRELREGQHLGSDRLGGQGARTRSARNAPLCLRFDDTDSNDWSLIADQMIDLMLAGRIWRVDYSDNLDDFWSESENYEWDEVQHRWQIIFLD